MTAPIGVVATDGTFLDRIRVSWLAVPGTATYKVFQSASANGTFTQVGLATSALQLDVTPSTTSPVFFKIKASNPLTDSAFSTADSGFATLIPPQNVAASQAQFSDRIRITWNAVSAATGYKVFSSASSNSGFALLTTLSGNQTTFDHLTSSNASVFYRVRATVPGEESASSATVRGSVLRPPTITASKGTIGDHIRVEWPAAQDVTDYRLFRATSASGPFNQVGGTLSRTFFLNSSPTTTPIFFRVVSTKNGVDSLPSNTDSGFVGIAAPTNVAATDGTFSGAVRITWTAVTGASSFKVFRAASATGTFTQIGTSTVTRFDDTTAPIGTTFSYKVKATGSVGDSAFSSADSGVRQ